jgi:hypothetical protein
MSVGAVHLTGITRNAGNAPIPNCTVLVFRSADNTLFATVTSNGQGRYSVQVDPGVSYFLVAYSNLNVYGVTARNLVGS